MTEPKNHADVYGVHRNGVTHLNRVKPFDGKCEWCPAVGDLRPYGAGGEWICFDCAKKDPETTERRMGQVIFGEGLS
jgi:hypothetical protein